LRSIGGDDPQCFGDLVEPAQTASAFGGNQVGDLKANLVTPAKVGAGCRDQLPEGVQGRLLAASR
jgi:hypothetical protein